ncbi:MAG: amidohydrolase family protein [Bacteroidota bacterium]
MKNVLLALLAISCLACSPTEPERPPIIDMHLHDYGEGRYYVATAADGTKSPATYEEYKKQVFAYFEQYNVVKAVVSTIGGPWKPDSAGIFIPGTYLEEPPTDTLAFKELIESGNLKVFGEIGAVYVGRTLSDSLYDPYLELCNRYNIPVAIHTGGGPPNVTYFSPRFRIAKGDPYTVEDVLVKYPDLKIYLMHAGTSYHEHTLELMRTHPKVYVDLGVILWWDTPEQDFAEAFLRKAKRYGYIDRVMYGSDQMVWPHAIEKSIKQLESYDFLTEQDKRDIFYHNAKRFLDLEEQEMLN